jgi:hypothetical protein
MNRSSKRDARFIQRNDSRFDMHPPAVKRPKSFGSKHCEGCRGNGRHNDDCKNK